MLKLILPEGRIVSIKDKYGNEETYDCDGKHEFQKPLAVLVNGYSASASEIFAGAVKTTELVPLWEPRRTERNRAGIILF